MPASCRCNVGILRLLGRFDSAHDEVMQMARPPLVPLRPNSFILAAHNLIVSVDTAALCLSFRLSSSRSPIGPVSAADSASSGITAVQQIKLNLDRRRSLPPGLPLPNWEQGSVISSVHWSCLPSYDTRVSPRYALTCPRVLLLALNVTVLNAYFRW